ncbi:PQQ-dependent catabolism-associated beta-propeller protein [Methyloceanibacter methanicus]|uniref:PQQ-dependent catabolism-associated beta-propeller protein n=1 Tax=Methyloceanibacter methanicus TaxID=1774968 RepID=UPI000B03A344
MKRRNAAMLVVAPIAMLAVTPAYADKIFVSNERDNTVTVVDSDSLETIKTIATGRRPRGIVTSPDKSEVYVCVGDDNAVEVIDAGSLEIVRNLDSGPDPELMDVSKDGKTIYIANEDDSMVTIMKPDTGDLIVEVPVGVEPEGMRVSPDGTMTVATSESSSMAHFIDTESNDLVANVLVDTRPRHAEWQPDGKNVWVSSEVGGTVSVIDGGTYEIAKVIGFEIPGVSPEQIQPVGIRFSKDGTKAYVALGPATGLRWSTPTRSRWKTTFSSGSVPGTWRSHRTAPSSMSRTVSPTI